MRAVVEQIRDRLLASHRDTEHVHLDDLADAFGSISVSQDELDEVVSRLEAAGLRVGEALDERDVAGTSELLATARRLAATLGRRPTVEEIAAESGKSARSVRRAFERAAAAGKPRRAPG